MYVFVYDQSIRIHDQTSMVFDQSQGVNDSSVDSTISRVYVYGSG
jgi:hypothetical protein